MLKRLLCICFGVVISAGASAASWQHIGSPEGETCGNYCGVMQHKDRVYLVSNAKQAIPGTWTVVRNDCPRGSRYCRGFSFVRTPGTPGGRTGDIWLQSSDSITGPFDEAYNPIAREELAQYLLPDGREMEYARVIGIASDGETCHMMPHVGNQYGTANKSIPAYATSSDCETWEYHGPVTLDGAVNYEILLASAGYVVDAGVHYFISDAWRDLRVYVSYNGMDYTTFNTIPRKYTNDRPVFVDMTYCKGQYHLTYENAWDNSNIIRHEVSDDLINWTMLDNDIGVRDYKGMNIGCIDDRLYGIAFGGSRLYEYK